MITYSRYLTSEDGVPLAVVALDLSLGNLMRYFSDSRLAEGGYGLIVDENLRIITTPTRALVGQPLSVLKSPDIYKIMGELNMGVDLKGFKTRNNTEDGETVLIHTRRLANGWHLGIVTPISKYNKDIYDNGVFIVIMGILLQLFLSLVVLRIAAARQKSEDKSNQKSSFLASMSHEIRTPMNAIIGFAELALREDIPPAAYEHIFTIKQAGANLLSIINDILDISKIESGKLEIHSSDYLFSSLVNDVVSIIKMRATYARLRFVVNVDSNIPNALLGDEVRVRQILLNLLSNAVKYTDKGFVALDVSVETMTEDTAVLKIDVTDSGKGIGKEDIEKLFKDFVRIDRARNKGIEGTGLGLAITKNILKLMNGEITVHSEYGKGSTFTVLLPQKFGDPKKHAFVDEPSQKSVLLYERREIYAASVVRTIENLGVSCTLVAGESELDEKVGEKAHKFIFTAPALYERTKNIALKHRSDAKIVLLTEFGDAIAEHNVTILSMPVYSVAVANILNGVPDSYDYGGKKESMAKFIAPEANVMVVDDTGTNLRVAEGLLAPYRMRLTLCKSGHEAIEEIKSGRFDLIFMDHMMPGMDGVEATKRIRGLGGEYYRKLPIIALTANAVAGVREMFLGEGLNDFISKPIDIVKLNSALDRWIPKEKRMSPADENAATACLNGAGEVDIGSILIDGVEVKKGLATSGGNSAYYVRTLTMFYEDGLSKIEEIKKCLSMGDLHLYATHVHGLKSASASIGAIELSKAALDLESAGKENNIAFVNAYNAKFLMDLEALLRNIGIVLDQIEAGKASPSLDAPAETLKPELTRLKEALDHFDSEVIDQATMALQEFEHAVDYGSDVKAILQDVLIGEYDNAIVLIDEVLEKLKEASNTEEPGDPLV